MWDKKRHVSVLFLILLFLGGRISAEENGLIDNGSKETNEVKKCLIDKINQLPGDLTISEFRAQCQAAVEATEGSEKGTAHIAFPGEEDLSVIGERLFDEGVMIDNPFVITAHKPNYVMPVTFNTKPNEAPYAGLEGSLQNVEVKFQLSLKFQVAKGILWRKSLLFLAYTNQSYWQAYNRDFSSPFRETNHEPEMFLLIPQTWKVLGIQNRMIALGISHQSNGRPGTQSRSWNRIYGNFIFEHRNVVFSLRPWYRIPESRKRNISDPRGDDNPDILNYMGHGEARVIYKFRQNTVSIMLRNLMNTEYKGAVEVGWSFSIGDKAKGYIQYFNGYGESLIDYNASINRLSIGVALTDWL